MPTGSEESEREAAFGVESMCASWGTGETVNGWVSRHLIRRKRKDMTHCIASIIYSIIMHSYLVPCTCEPQSPLWLTSAQAWFTSLALAGYSCSCTSTSTGCNAGMMYNRCDYSSIIYHYHTGMWIKPQSGRDRDSPPRVLFSSHDEETVLRHDWAVCSGEGGQSCFNCDRDATGRMCKISQRTCWMKTTLVDRTV